MLSDLNSSYSNFDRGTVVEDGDHLGPGAKVFHYLTGNQRLYVISTTTLIVLSWSMLVLSYYSGY